MLLDELRGCGSAASSRVGLPDSCLEQLLFFGVSRHVQLGDTRRHASDDGTRHWNRLSCVFADTLNQWKSLPEDAPYSTVSPLRTVLRDMLHEAHLGMQCNAAVRRRVDNGFRASQVTGLRS